MRKDQLKSLLAVLRAAGVSEFSDGKSGVSVKLGHAPVVQTVIRGKKATVETPDTREGELVNEILASKKAQAELLKLGVDAETAARELADVS